MTRDDLKYVLKIMALFLVISFFIDKMIFFTLNKISDKVYSGQSVGKLNHFLEIKDDLDYVIFGSSRANHHVDPYKISKNGFNMGMDGTKIAYSATLLKVLPKQKKQLIFFHIDPENVFSTKYTGSDINGLGVKYNRNDIFKTEIDKLEKNNIVQKFYWSLSYNGKVLGILKNFFMTNYDYKSYYGYDPLNLTKNQKNIFERIIENDKIEDCQDNFDLNKVYNGYLDDLALFNQENNKALVFFTSPKFNDYCKEDNIKFEKIMKDKGLIYYDFSDFFKKDNSHSFWRDKTHLSNKGAIKFTKRIYNIFNVYREKSTAL